MEDEKLFQIGDVARMFHLSPGSLRHYEQAGLLKPEYIDAQTGYRYYSVRQFEVLNTIRYLRALDMPIRQIEDFLKNRDIDVIENKLLKQKELIERKQRELALIERKIDHRLQQLRDAMNSELDVIQRKTLPACRMVVVKDSLQPQSYLELEYAIRRLTENQAESVVFLGKVGVGISKERLMKHRFEQYDSVFLVLDEEDRYEGSVDEHPEERCVSIRFCGSHKEAGERYKKLMEYMEKEKLQAADFSREITMIDYGITNNTDKFVTEIC
ncbi:MAG: MerR family transcriptional regulator, partial [Lachnospiraceae bacterium]|nr:MerR family transcriptional regulator [Lachnospiraceae bacterium]